MLLNKPTNNISKECIAFKIVDSPCLFRDRYYQRVSYRLVILHAMQYYFSKNGNKSARILLEELQHATEETSNGYYERRFLELYLFNKMQKIGLVIIDRSKGCFPLLLYPDDRNPVHGNRIWAFQQMLSNDLLLSHEIYDDLLKKSHVWDEMLVNQLRTTFIFPERKQQQDNIFIDNNARNSL